MSQADHCPELAMQKTRSAFLWTRVLRAPFWALYCMLPIILYKDLNATPLQLGAFFALKPMTSLFSLYWSASIQERPDRLLSNIILAGILGLLPFFFSPFIDGAWFFVVASGFFMMMYRGSVPAWIEILRQNLPKGPRERIFAFGNAIGYLGDGLFPFALGWALDAYTGSWRWIFPLTAVVWLVAIFFQRKIPIKQVEIKPELTRAPLSEHLLKPWKNAWKLISTRPDFARFQMGFMLGGAGLMIVQPALPAFFVDQLNLSYTELAIALTFCKGIGFALTSPLWTQVMGRTTIFRFSGYVVLLAALFPVILLSANWSVAFVYLAYFAYGAMQAGSKLCWNLSGPVFAGEEDSSTYTSTNILTVGLRGCFVPAIGSYLCLAMGAPPVILLGGAFCLLGANWMRERTVPVPQLG